MTAPTEPLSHLELGTLITPDNDRERALDFALRFHLDTEDDDPKNVVETAGTFLAFLQGDA